MPAGFRSWIPTSWPKCLSSWTPNPAARSVWSPGSAGNKSFPSSSPKCWRGSCSRASIATILPRSPLVTSPTSLSGRRISPSLTLPILRPPPPPSPSSTRRHNLTLDRSRSPHRPQALLLVREALDDVAPRLLVVLQLQQVARLRFLEQLTEGAKPVIGFVEAGVAPFQRLLDHRSPDLLLFAALFKQVGHGFQHQFEPRLFFLILVLGTRLAHRLGGDGLAGAPPLPSGFAHQVVVKDELVAVGNEQVRGGLLHADSDHDLVVLAQLADQRREIGIAADDHEGVDVRLGVAEVQRIDDHADVGRVLAGLAHVRDLDQLECRLVHDLLEVLVTFPVAVGLLDDDVPFEKQALQHLPNIEFGVLRVAHAQRDILEIAEHGHVLSLRLSTHNAPSLEREGCDQDCVPARRSWRERWEKEPWRGRGGPSPRSMCRGA